MVVVVLPNPVRTLIPGCARATPMTSLHAPWGVVAVQTAHPGVLYGGGLNPHPSRGKTWPEPLGLVPWVEPLNLGLSTLTLGLVLYLGLTPNPV